MNGDCYSILGVPTAATAEEIRAAYRRLARQYHPDLNSNPEAEARMKEINEAYATLSDPARRRYYDIYGTADPTNIDVHSQSRQRSRRSASADPPSSRPFSPRRGDDIPATVLITRREARQGCRKTFPVARLETCPRCRGTGQEPEETLDAGQCWRCAGEQRLRHDLTLNATIPAGMSDGRRLRLRGQGHAGVDGGPNGHIYVTVRVVRNTGLHRTLAFVWRHLFS